MLTWNQYCEIINSMKSVMQKHI